MKRWIRNNVQTLNFNYRDIKEKFSEIDSIAQINRTLSEKTGEISDKELAISLDISTKKRMGV